MGASKVTAVVAFALFAVSCTSFSQSADARLTLHMMPSAAEQQGAVCLDGSPAGFYILTNTSSTTWQIFFEGGGWCYDLVDCFGRAGTNLGSSVSWGSSQTLHGLMASDCDVNPTFCAANKVFVPYCDGASFTGDVAEPVTVAFNGTERELHFRGRRNRDAVFETLLREHGLKNAQEVLVTGSSAGGLAAYIHADAIRDLLLKETKLRKYGVAPVSGFFLPHGNIDGQPVYATQMKQVFDMQNSTGGLNAECVKEQGWRCIFAPESLKYTVSEVFMLNSAWDSWQSKCIFTADLAPGFPNQTDLRNGDCACVDSDFAKTCVYNPEWCDDEELGQINNYIDDFQAALPPMKNVAGFVHSCLTHGEATKSQDFTSISIDGVTMQQALTAWWRSDNNSTFHLPCHYTIATPHMCNPTCANLSSEY